jgi:PTS system mannose-specific IID component
MFLLYNIVNVSSKYYGIHMGYEKGISLINGSETNILQRLTNMANIVGLMVVGGLIASSVKMKVALEFGAGENVILLQDLFDKVMPGLLSLLVTVAVYFLLKKTNGKHAPLLILGTMIVCILLVTIGVL